MDTNTLIRNATADADSRCRRLERALAERNRELSRLRAQVTIAHHDTIERLIAAAQCRDRDTGEHIERIGRYSGIIARRLGLSDDAIEVLTAAAPMHDVGKLAIPDAILKKTSALTSAERLVMEQHTVIGSRMLQGSDSPLLQVGATIALAHHERWDGSGYPYRLAGDAIPLEARICAVADVYDALSTNRRYREALPRKTVLGMMQSRRGRHFDPGVLDAFLGCRTEIEHLRLLAAA